MTFDVRKIREDFPLLARQVHGKPLVYLDNGATTQKPRQVIESLTDFYSNHNANIHRGNHGLGAEATALYEQARGSVDRFMGSDNGNQVVFTRNTTESINLVAQAWGRANVQAGDEILLTEAEHHANFVPWWQLAQEKGAVLKVASLTPDGLIDLASVKALLSPKTKVFAFGWVSNVLGGINPAQELCALAKAHGALVVVDAAQAAPHFALHAKELGADFIAFSAHKMLGPTGLGVLWGKEEVLNAMPPWQGGGSMIATVTPESITWNRLPWKFEAGTPNIADAVAFAASLKYLKDLGWEALEAHEKALTEKALASLQAIDGLTLYGPKTAKDRLGVFSFNLAGVDAGDAGAILDSLGLELRVGNLCAQPLMKHFACAGMIRASFYLYNTLEEVDLLAEGLKRAQKMLGKAPAKA
jgi:cysteine desulfurase/selenocysteine lyase